MLHFQDFASISLITGLGLVFLRGRFWLADQRLELVSQTIVKDWPTVTIVIPARNEEKCISLAIRSLIDQDYPGEFSIVIVNDNSSDQTEQIVNELTDKNIFIVNGTDPPNGWTGKLWALSQGIKFSAERCPVNDYYLFTDADIVHPSYNLERLVKKAEVENLQLVSLMVLLKCSNFWEKLMIPAFVFFFQMLYPFAWVNNPRGKTAGAAGGCLLLRRQALENIGGLSTISSNIIDDCALGKAIKNTGPIWIGLSDKVKSIRDYNSFSKIHDMVIRSAFEQLNNSLVLLFFAVSGMIILFILPPLAFVLGFLLGDQVTGLLGLCSWLIVSIIYMPTQKLYGRPIWETFCLPVATVLYGLITINSARYYLSKKSIKWRGRSH